MVFILQHSELLAQNTRAFRKTIVIPSSNINIYVTLVNPTGNSEFQVFIDLY